MYPEQSPSHRWAGRPIIGRVCRALLVICLIPILGGLGSKHGGIPAVAASFTLQPAGGNGLTGTITYLQTYKHETTTTPNGGSHTEGEEATIRATWVATGRQSSAAISTTLQDTGATMSLDYYDRTYTSNSTSTPMSCGANGTFIPVASTQSSEQVDTASVKSTATITVNINPQGQYSLTVLTLPNDPSEELVPLVPVATPPGGAGSPEGTETRTQYDSIGGNWCHPKPSRTITTNPFVPVPPQLGTLSGARDPKKPLEFSGGSTSGSPDGKGGVRTTTITWNLTLAPERCAPPYEESGSRWVARFPGSTAISDLAPAFQAPVRGFLRALKAAGVKVNVTSTYRPLERSYLMYYAYRIAKGQTDPASAPGMRHVNICWQHHDENGFADPLLSRLAAMAMVSGYHIVSPPALLSRHTLRLAIDMEITWTGTPRVKDASGQLIAITGGPRNGGNPGLWAVGATYGVHKLPSDPVYWSDDGH